MDGEAEMKIGSSAMNNMEKGIVFLFSALPFIDMLNGIMSSTLPIGSIYKLLLCIVLLLNILRINKCFSQKALLVFLLVISYVLFSIGFNVLFFNGEINTLDYPVKLLFNIALLLLFVENYRICAISGNSLYLILDYSCWIMIACYLIPYVLGLGNTVYSGEMGYKGFFIAQNELGVNIVILSFFAAFKLINYFSPMDFIKLMLLVLCGVLLNTKTAIIASFIAVCIWFFYILRKGSFKVRWISIFLFIIGLLLLKDKIISAVSNSILRYSTLQNKYYGGSVLTSILSGRNYNVQNAWQYLNEEHIIFRSIFGNGFCSDILTEMDIIDIFFFLGIIGAVGAMIFIIWIFKKCCSNCKKDKTLLRPLSFIIICILSTLAGHVLFMAMSGCYFVIYCCFLMFYSSEQKDDGFRRNSNENISCYGYL